jgi:hypothetical protein
MLEVFNKKYICRMAEELMLALCRHFLLEKFFNKPSCEFDKKQQKKPPGT